VLKAVQDALNDFLWVDDCQVSCATVRTAIDRACPRTEVLVELVGRAVA
jgi:Holliday junction resolvase RusA-like endonuclease